MELIWGLSVPNKIRNFLWRVCREAILVKKKLKRRKILTEGICDHCKLSLESVSHALWECPELLCIWNSIPAYSFHLTKTFTSLSELFLYVHEEGESLDWLPTVMWTIWYRRNQIRVSNRDFPITQVIPQASQTVSDFHCANLLSQNPSSIHTESRVQWTPPPTVPSKINFGGAKFQGIGRAGIGAVIRNFQGQAIANLSKQTSLPHSSDMVEALAAT